MTDAAPTARRAVSVIIASPVYRSAAVALLLAGLAVSAMLPQLTIFFVDDLGATPTVAGLYYLTNAVAPVGGFLIGRLSDRSPDRLRLVRRCVLVGTVGWLLMAASTRIWMPFLINATVLAVAGAAGAQLFAAVRDELDRTPTGVDHQVIATVRMAYTAGFVLGPVLGSVLGGLIGLRWMMVVSAGLVAAQLLPLSRIAVSRVITDSHARSGAPTRGMGPLVVFAALCVLALSGDTAKVAYLPLYLHDGLHVSDAVRGAVMSTQPLLELLLIPVFGWWADRVDPVRLVALGAVFGTAANLCYATSSTVLGLFVGQVLMAGLWGAMAGLGVSVAQRLLPHAVGVASGVFLSAITCGLALGGLIGGVGVDRLGLPGVFFIPFVLCCVAVGGLILLAVRGTSGTTSGTWRSRRRLRRSGTWSSRTD